MCDDLDYIDLALARIQTGLRVRFIPNNDLTPWAVVRREPEDGSGFPLYRATFCHTPEAALIAYRAHLFDAIIGT